MRRRSQRSGARRSVRRKPGSLARVEQSSPMPVQPSVSARRRGREEGRAGAARAERRRAARHTCRTSLLHQPAETSSGPRSRASPAVRDATGRGETVSPWDAGVARDLRVGDARLAARALLHCPEPSMRASASPVERSGSGRGATRRRGHSHESGGRAWELTRLHWTCVVESVVKSKQSSPIRRRR